MLVAGFPAGPWGTNCWVAAAAAGAECVVIDPGMDALGPLQDLLQQHRLKPVAVLLTHGHMDHMWSVTPVADGYGIPAVVHAADQALLTRPDLAVSAETAELIRGLGADFVEPAELRVVNEDAEVEFAGLKWSIRHAPGHTAGSMVFHSVGEVPLMFSGDVLFRDAIGRTDLPGGDHSQMLASLARVVLPAADETVVHCGHGPSTTIGRERRENPYLRSLAGREQ